MDAERLEPDELIRIAAVHEAGHAVYAARCKWLIESVKLQPSKFGTEPGETNVVFPKKCTVRISDRLRYHAAGAAGEILVFGSYKEYGVIHDKQDHTLLAKRSECTETFDQSVACAQSLLDRNSVEIVAHRLWHQHLLSHEDVYDLLGLVVEW